MSDVDLATLGIKIDATDVTPAASKLDLLKKSGSAAENAIKALGLAFSAVAFAALAKNAAELATKFESLGTVMRVTGNNAGYTSDQMNAASKAIEANSFTMVESREIAVKLAIAHIDLSKAQQLSVEAQDLAAASGVRSTEAFDTLKDAIVSGREVSLKQLGLNVDFASSYYTLAKAAGKTVETLTDNEKAQARLNAVIELSTTVAGTFASNLNTTGGQIKELGDEWENAKTKLGAVFLPVLIETVTNLKDALSDMNVELAKTGSQINIDNIGTGLASAFRTVYETVAVTGATIAFMVKTIVNDITDVGRIAYDILDFNLYHAFEVDRKMMERAAADRKALDAFTETILKGPGTSSFIKPVVTNETLSAQAKIREDIAAREEAYRVKEGINARKKTDQTQKDIEADKLAVAELKARTEAAGNFLEALVKETDQAGLTSLAAHRVTAEYAAALAPTLALTLAIIDQEEAYQAASLASEVDKIAKQSQIDLTNDLNSKTADQIKFAKERLEQLNFENSLTGKNVEQVAALTAAHELEKQGIKEGTIAWILYGDAIVKAAAAGSKEQFNVEAANAYLQILERVESRTREAAANMAEAFGSVGKAVGDLSVIIAANASRQAGIQAKLSADIKKYGKDSIEGKRAESEANRDTAANEIKNTGDILGAVKGAFSEKTAIYKALQAAETVYRAVQLIGAIQSVAITATETTAQVAAASAQGTAWGIVAQVKALASLPFPFNFAALAAVTAALVGVGVKLFGGSGASAPPPGSTDAADRQKVAGTGSLLGDKTAKSNSIDNAVEIATKNSNQMLEYTNDMVSSLRNIKDNIGNLTNLVARQLSVSSGIFDTSSSGLGSSGSSFLFGLFGSKKTVSLQDLGISFQAQSIGQILAQGIAASTYQQLLTTKSSSFFGISSTSSNVSTVTGNLSGDIKNQLQSVIQSLKSGIITAASVLGVQGAAQAIDSFKISIGKLSLNGLNGSEIQDELNSVFSSIVDNVSQAIIPGLKEFQKVGEGAFATLTRISREYEVVDVVLSSMSKTFDLVGISSIGARDNLVQLSGGLDDFTSKAKFYVENFLTDAQQLSPVVSAVSKEMDRLGFSSVKTKDQFATLVKSIDVSTSSGAALYTALLNVAPAFARVADQVAKTALAYRDASETIRGTIADLRSVNGARSVSSARAAFVSGLASAQTGDINALNSLSGLAQNLARASATGSASALSNSRDLAIIRAGLSSAADLADVLGANTDYNSLMLQAANDNLQQARNAQDAATAASSAMLEEQQALRAELAAVNAKLERYARITAETLQRVTRDGESMLTEAA